jgi:dihydrofolate synthase/folylpolyglutamate synthase
MSKERLLQFLPGDLNMHATTLEQRIATLSSASRGGRPPGLEPIQRLLSFFDHPELQLRTIHVGGTSGKGSTATFIAEILQAAGYNVGLFTKPHLVSVVERFVINGVPGSTEELMELLDQMEAASHAVRPTWFELLVALACLFFHRRGVDVAVIEVGIGGTFDVTNVVRPEVALLTNVGLDHTRILGGTIEQIAREKAGIIKFPSTVVSAVRQSTAISIVEERCRQVGVPLHLLDRDFAYTIRSLSAEGSCFDVEIGKRGYRQLRLSALGMHQVENATLAVATTAVLSEKGFPVAEPALRAALATAKLPGRLEVIHQKPLVVLDGAHSPPKMGALARAIGALFPEHHRFIGVLAFSEGHDAAVSLGSLAPLLDVAVLTTFSVDTDYGSRTAQQPQDLAATLSRLDESITLFTEPDPRKALAAALEIAGPLDLVCVTGSIFLVGQIRSWLRMGKRRAGS